MCKSISVQILCIKVNKYTLPYHIFMYRFDRSIRRNFIVYFHCLWIFFVVFTREQSAKKKVRHRTEKTTCLYNGILMETIKNILFTENKFLL